MALIVVLGFLSLMVLAAVAFLTHARMERMVADSTLDAQRGRQLVRTAVNAAMNDYSAYLDQNQLIMPINPAERLFTSRPASGAFGLGGRTSGDDGIELLVGEVKDWIPRRYMRHLVPAAQQTPDMLDGPDLVKNAQWILVREDPTRGQSRILGRYAYACFDMSGGIDANLIARTDEIAGNDARIASNRIRHTVRHVPMRLLPEVADFSTFKSLRRGWQGFDSLQMLIKLTDGKGNSGDDPPSADRWQPERKEVHGAGLNSNLVSDLTPFSLSAFRGGRYTAASGLWTPYVLINENTDWQNVLQPIANQFPGGLPDWIDDAIGDYTSASVTPKGTDYPSPKNVPMFNEVAGKFELKEEPDSANPGFSKYYLETELNFEFWYPFPSQDNEGGSFQLEPPAIGGGFATSGGTEIWIRMALMAPGMVQVELDPGTLPSPLAVAANWNGGKPYSPGASPDFAYRQEIKRPPGETNPIPAGATLRIQSVMTRKPIYLTAGGGNADMLPTDLTLARPLSLQKGQPAKFANAVTDPRLNHLAGQWVEENGGEGSIGEMNNWGGSTRDRFLAEGTNLYCRNRPMETPAELGFISTGKEWETIDLCTPEAVTLMATLVADTNLWVAATGGINKPWTSTNVFYTNGTINLNTRSSNVLASAFVDLATHEVPNIPTSRIEANPIDENTAMFMAEKIMEATEAGTIDTCFHAGTDWVSIPAMQQNGALWRANGLNNNQREALIRNTWGLFNPENSLFTVVVVAQPIKEGPVGVGLWDPNVDLITGERRAVVLAWRDPFRTGRNLHHEMFIRMFRYLND